jgi:glycosyltransferase involved in cell wall biosynthesis
MKALLLVSELEDYTISFVNGVAQHIPVVLGVPHRRYAHLAQWFSPAVDLRLLDWPRHRSPSNLQFLLGLTSLVKRERPNVIHLLSHMTLWLNLAVPFWRPIPVITTVHDVDVHPGDSDSGVLPRWATSLIVRQSEHVLVHGEHLKMLALDRYAKASNRVHVLPHPAIVRYAELARRQHLTRRVDDGAFTVLLFGRIFAYKGLEQLIRAEATIRERVPNLRIVIAGRGDDPWIFRHLMGDPERYDIRNHFIEDQEVAQTFLDADLVVLPYTEASQSGVLNLAAAFGKPVIATDVGELGSTVKAHGIGLVVEPNDPQGLGDKIALLAKRPDLRAEFGENARKWAEGTNAPESVGALAATLYHAVIEECARR